MCARLPLAGICFAVTRSDPVSPCVPPWCTSLSPRPSAHGMMFRMTSPDARPAGGPSAPILTMSVEQRDDGVAVLRVAGEIDLVTAPQLEESISHALTE